MIAIFSKLKKPLVIIGVSLLTAVVLGEVFFRIAYYEQLKIRSYPSIYQPDKSLSYRYIPEKEANICIPSISKSFVVNKNGYYGPSFELQKTEGTFRIAIIGSSEASGIWLDTDTNFSMKLQRHFIDNKYNVEVINFSVDGSFRDVFNTRLIKNEVIKYRPDLVLMNAFMPFAFGHIERDVYKNYLIIYTAESENSKNRCKAKVDYITKHTGLIGLYNVSFIIRAACRYYMLNYENGRSENLKYFVENKFQAEDVLFYSLSVKKSVAMLNEVRATLNARESTFLLFRYNNESFYRTTMASNNLSCLFLDLPKDSTLRHEHNGHLNENGHAFVAQRLYEELLTIFR